MNEDREQSETLNSANAAKAGNFGLLFISALYILAGFNNIGWTMHNLAFQLDPTESVIKPLYNLMMGTLIVGLGFFTMYSFLRMIYGKHVSLRIITGIPFMYIALSAVDLIFSLALNPDSEGVYPYVGSVSPALQLGYDFGFLWLEYYYDYIKVLRDNPFIATLIGLIIVFGFNILMILWNRGLFSRIGLRCPSCGEENTFHKFRFRKTEECAHCGSQFVPVLPGSSLQRLISPGKWRRRFLSMALSISLAYCFLIYYLAIWEEERLPDVTLILWLWLAVLMPFCYFLLIMNLRSLAHTHIVLLTIAAFVVVGAAAPNFSTRELYSHLFWPLVLVHYFGAAVLFAIFLLKALETDSSSAREKLGAWAKPAFFFFVLIAEAIAAVVINFRFVQGEGILSAAVLTNVLFFLLPCIPFYWRKITPYIHDI